MGDKKFASLQEVRGVGLFECAKERLVVSLCFLGLNAHEKASRFARLCTYDDDLSVGLGFGFGQLAVFVGVKTGKFGDVIVHACGLKFGQ